MRNFILGIIVTIVLIVAVGLVFVDYGLLPTTADVTPPEFEQNLAMSAHGCLHGAARPADRRIRSP